MEGGLSRLRLRSGKDRRPVWRWRRFALGPAGCSVLGTIAVFGVLVVTGLVLVQRLSLSEAENAAGIRGAAIARVSLAPYLVDGLLVQDADALARLDAVAKLLVDHGEVIHLKIWSQDERLLWADDATLVGGTFDLGDDARSLFGTEDVTIGIGSVDEAENGFGTQTAEPALEVYVAVYTEPSKTPILVETYFSHDSVAGRAAELRRTFLPFFIGGLAALVAAQIPLTRSLARRLGRYQREREQLLKSAFDAAFIERQRIAADVHDGALQELIGVSFAIHGVVQTAPEPTRSVLADLDVSTRRSIRSLRSVLSSIYPAELPSITWTDGLDDLVILLRERGVEVKMDVGEADMLPIDRNLSLRIAREAIRNSLAHAESSSILIRQSGNRSHPCLTISDDGRGFDVSTAAQRRNEGHLGIQLMRDLAHGAGAILTIESAPGSGTTVRLLAGGVS